MNVINRNGVLTRDSNMELLRIFSMLLVMGLHSLIVFDFPVHEDTLSSPLASLTYFFIESVTIIAVNVFVMISGWYGINPKKKNFLAFLFQIAFFGILMFLAESVIKNGDNLTVKGIKHLLLAGPDDFWFVKAYILLYILAPVLNAFIEHSSKQTFQCVLIAFFSFQSLYGWFLPATHWYAGGYSTISFIGIYLLARYMNMYKPQFTQFSLNKDILIFLFGGVVSSVIWSFGLCRFNIFFYDRAFMYTSPMVILSAAYLILIFSKISIKNRLVNWVAASSFAVYLFHYNPLFYYYYCDLSVWCYNQNLVLRVILFPLMIVSVFAFAVLLDQVRKFIWSKISVRVS